MNDKYLMSLNVRTHERDPEPPSPWKHFYNRCFGLLLLALLLTALVKCSTQNL